ncbi:MAG: delta-60 repeat domain-containing protein [Thermoanaerobaculia bacterium]
MLLGLFPEPDGAILAVGTAWDGSRRLPAMARFLPNGDADPAFGDSGLLYLATTPWASSQLNFVTAKRAANGRIVLAGHCRYCPSNAL